MPSDDTQMAFWTLEQLLEDGGYVPEHVARCFATRRIFGIGGRWAVPGRSKHEACLGSRQVFRPPATAP